MRKICYITGTRADYGLMRNTLREIHNRLDFELDLIVTGMHLLQEYGETWKEIRNDKLTIANKVKVDLSGHGGAEMSIALGEQVIGITKSLSDIKPDIVLLLGDRGEMLAGAIAALHLNIHIVHIHGGELSGTVDESVRHAISKLSHYHFTATEKSRNRLIKMGEKKENIFVTGAPGLDEIYQTRLVERRKLMKKYNIDAAAPFFLVLFHPVVQQLADVQQQIRTLLTVLHKIETQCLIILPNSDAGGSIIKNEITQSADYSMFEVIVHVPRVDFLSLVSYADIMIGNSSSGIIEAASLATPVVNIGDRQRCRERNPNVVDAAPETADLTTAIQKAQTMIGLQWSNVYGDGHASEKIVDILRLISLSPTVLEKINAY